MLSGAFLEMAVRTHSCLSFQGAMVGERDQIMWEVIC